ncbi:MAG: endolytic transglycosylase MltG [Thermoleophilaceae bacterium]|nr:endolytic transglycosylase MltG [Thermoleophilaceae bacterium]
MPGGRTDRERERARAEREARRRTAWDEPLPDFDFGVRARGDAERARAARRPRPAVRVRRGRLAALAATVALLAVAVWFLVSLLQPFAGDGSDRVRVTIPRGASLGTIADRLDRQGVISSQFFFKLRTRIEGRSGDFKPGTYTLAKGMSYGAVIDALVRGVAPGLVRITIPEGRARREIEPLVRQAGLRGDYLAASKASPALDPRRYGAGSGASLEGFLFPATYELKKGATAKDLVAKQLAAFRQEIRGVDMSYARSKNLTVYDVLIIASMVEREAQLDRERPLIASVIYNRLKRGMPLGIDATIRFATGNWSRPLRQSQLEIQSGYNTRTHVGLPPGPIGNPGLKSIVAAAHPARTGYLFYVVKPGTCGEHAFSATDAQFQRDVARYNGARAAQGGKSPTTCK